MSLAVLGIGGNVAGAWGEPVPTLAKACRELERSGARVVARSSLWLTQPVGGVAQPVFVNAVLVVRTKLAPHALLVVCKRLERAAGRRRGVRNGPRPLDLDILAYDDRVLGGSGRVRRAGRLVIPHPELHRRAFVLVPLAEVAPRWRHPASGLSAAHLVRRLPPRSRRLDARVPWPASDPFAGAGCSG